MELDLSWSMAINIWRNLFKYSWTDNLIIVNKSWKSIVTLEFVNVEPQVFMIRPALIHALKQCFSILVLEALALHVFSVFPPQHSWFKWSASRQTHLNLITSHWFESGVLGQRDIGNMQGSFLKTLHQIIKSISSVDLFPCYNVLTKSWHIII